MAKRQSKPERSAVEEGRDRAAQPFFSSESLATEEEEAEVGSSNSGLAPCS